MWPRRIDPRRDGVVPEGIAVLVAASLREVNVEPGRLDVTEQLMLRHPLEMSHRGHDVPVPELASSHRDRDGPCVLEMHGPGRHRIYRCAVRRRDVDAGVKGLVRTGEPRTV